jgi:hypothetical protein
MIGLSSNLCRGQEYVNIYIHFPIGLRGVVLGQLYLYHMIGLSLIRLDLLQLKAFFDSICNQRK